MGGATPPARCSEAGGAAKRREVELRVFECGFVIPPYPHVLDALTIGLSSHRAAILFHADQVRVRVAHRGSDSDYRA